MVVNAVTPAIESSFSGSAGDALDPRGLVEVSPFIVFPFFARIEFGYRPMITHDAGPDLTTLPFFV